VGNEKTGFLWHIPNAVKVKWAENRGGGSQKGLYSGMSPSLPGSREKGGGSKGEWGEFISTRISYRLKRLDKGRTGTKREVECSPFTMCKDGRLKGRKEGRRRTHGKISRPQVALNRGGIAWELERGAYGGSPMISLREGKKWGKELVSTPKNWGMCTTGKNLGEDQNVDRAERGGKRGKRESP